MHESVTDALRQTRMPPKRDYVPVIDGNPSGRQLGRARAPEGYPAGIGQTPARRGVGLMSDKVSDREGVNESAIAEAYQNTAHSIRPLAKKRRDLLVGQRPVPLQERQDRPLHHREPTLERCSRSMPRRARAQGSWSSPARRTGPRTPSQGRGRGLGRQVAGHAPTSSVRRRQLVSTWSPAGVTRPCRSGRTVVLPRRGGPRAARRTGGRVASRLERAASSPSKCRSQTRLHPLPHPGLTYELH